jgi:hypothetical protein
MNLIPLFQRFQPLPTPSQGTTQDGDPLTIAPLLQSIKMPLQPVVTEPVLQHLRDVAAQALPLDLQISYKGYRTEQPLLLPTSDGRRLTVTSLRPDLQLKHVYCTKVTPQLIERLQGGYHVQIASPQHLQERTVSIYCDPKGSVLFQSLPSQ